MRALKKNPKTRSIPVGNVYEKYMGDFKVTITNTIISKRDELYTPCFTCTLVVTTHVDAVYPKYSLLVPDLTITTNDTRRDTFNLTVTMQEWFAFLNTVTKALQS